MHHFQRAKQPKQSVDIITEGIQGRKGQDIIIADLSNIEGAIANHSVTCQGNFPAQAEAISKSTGDTIREDLKEKPVNIIDLGANQWVAIGFTDVLVRVFSPETRVLYDLESLWEDAKLTRIPDQD